MTIVQCRAPSKSVKNRQPRAHNTLFVPAYMPHGCYVNCIPIVIEGAKYARRAQGADAHAVAGARRENFDQCDIQSARCTDQAQRWDMRTAHVRRLARHRVHVPASATERPVHAVLNVVGFQSWHRVKGTKCTRIMDRIRVSLGAIFSITVSCCGASAGPGA